MLNDLEHQLLVALKDAEARDEERHPFVDLECFADDPEVADEWWKDEYARRSKVRDLIAEAEKPGTSRFSR